MHLVWEDLIAPGIVDTRSIEDVTPNDLEGFTQCHFFAGIGVWSHSLRLAGWPDDRAVWTGSCPCQPFSAAGQGGGFVDERHLWPAWHHLIRERRPDVVFGEQVASPSGLAWLDLVHSDLEDAHYAVGAFDLCAAGVGAPHIRQRLYFVGHADEGRSGRHSGTVLGAEGGAEGRVRSFANGVEPTGATSSVADNNNKGREQLSPAWLHDKRQSGDDVTRRGEVSFWSACDWLPCTDGKTRPVEPGTFPLAYGAPARMGRLRAYGNSIVAPLAAEFIAAYMR